MAEEQNFSCLKIVFYSLRHIQRLRSGIKLLQAVIQCCKLLKQKHIKPSGHSFLYLKLHTQILIWLDRSGVSVQLGDLQCQPREPSRPLHFFWLPTESTQSSSPLIQASWRLASTWQTDCWSYLGWLTSSRRYHRYCQNTSYYSNNSGLKKYLILLELKSLPIFWANIQSLQRETIQTNNKDRSKAAISLSPSSRSTKLSNEIFFISLTEQSYFQEVHYGTSWSFWFLPHYSSPHLLSQNSHDTFFFFSKEAYLCSGPNVSRWAVCAGIWWSSTNTTFNWRARRSRSCHGFSIGRRLI